MLRCMNPTTRAKLNALKGFNKFYAARTVLQLPPRYLHVASASGIGDAVVKRRDDKAAARAKAKAQRASRKRNR